MSRGEPTKTIGHARAGGEKALTVPCLGCYHQAVKTFEELRLWNDMIFVDIAKHRQLVCSQCGSRNMRVMPIFPPASRYAGPWQVAGGAVSECATLTAPGATGSKGMIRERRL